jgi:hypothetical protein
MPQKKYATRKALVVCSHSLLDTADYIHLPYMLVASYVHHQTFVYRRPIKRLKRIRERVSVREREREKEQLMSKTLVDVISLEDTVKPVRGPAKK